MLRFICTVGWWRLSLDVVHDRVVKTFYPPASSVKSDRDAAEKVRSAINDH